MTAANRVDRRDEFDLATRRVLAISSGGGHWVELMRLRPAFQDAIVSYATVRTCDRRVTNERSIATIGIFRLGMNALPAS
jgi:hypothetical protein